MTPLDISDETLAQVLARAGAALELAAERERVATGHWRGPDEAGGPALAASYEDAAEACFAAARVLRARAR